MKISHALGIEGRESIAFVGAGGKTSAMFSLAGELTGPVLLSTSTHLGAWQADIADRHQIIHSKADLSIINSSFEGFLLLTGPPDENKRLHGLNGKILEVLGHICREKHIPLLIEADGARQRPIKAPADYEPVIPPWVNLVVVMAGLSGLGQPLSDSVVHRPELFSAITNLSPGDRIDVDDLVTVLRSERGGLKGIPTGTTRHLFLNQADDGHLASLGARIAHAVHDVYASTLIGSLQQGGDRGPIAAVHARTAGIILAAGSSERLGEPKQLMDWQGIPFVRQVAQNALEAGLSPVYVILGANQQSISASLKGLPVKIIHNPDWETGQASSMQAGLAALSDETDSAMFLLSDQPQTGSHLIRQLLERYAQNRSPITAPMVNGQRGNPVLFSQVTFKSLKEISGDQGGRKIFTRFEVDWLPWVDERALHDVDQPGDEMLLKQMFFTE